MSDNTFNCYNFDVTNGARPGGSFEHGSLGKYLDDGHIKHRTVVFKKTQKLAVKFFADLLSKYLDLEKLSPANKQIASAMTIELLPYKEPQDDSVGSVSFAIKYNGEPLPQLNCDIIKQKTMPKAIEIMQEIKEDSVVQYGFDSANHSISWYVDRARSMSHTK